MAELNSKSIVHVAQVVQHGENIQIPEKMSVAKAIELLQRFEKAQEEIIVVTRTFDVFPWDGAYGLGKVLANKFGWVDAIPTPGFFGPTPPKAIVIETGAYTKETIFWGRLSLAVLGKGFIQTGVSRKGNRLRLELTASVPRKSESLVTEIYNALEVYLASNSIYKGKAIKLRLHEDEDAGQEMVEPLFLDTSKIDVNSVVYPRDVEDALRTNLFTPICRMADCRKAGIPVKRGIMLAGPFGVGKTLAARNASKYATDHNVTYVYATRANELAEIIEFAKQYAPAVVFCEDIDRATDGERSVSMDDLLNILDGVDTKGAEIITVLTTNAAEKINPAMLRPGRLDAVIEIKKPDAPAIERLVRMYGGANIDQQADLTDVATLLAGNIPAVVAEVVHRAKLAQLSLTPEGEKLGLIGEQALMLSAESMRMQLDLLEGNRPEPEPTLDRAFRLQGEQLVEQLKANMISILRNAGLSI